jgi:rod shape-determining protein MreC
VQPAEGERMRDVGGGQTRFRPGCRWTVRFTASNVPEVQPEARLDRLEVVRLFDYGLRGVLAPESPNRPAERRR